MRRRPVGAALCQPSSRRQPKSPTHLKHRRSCRASLLARPSKIAPTACCGRRAPALPATGGRPASRAPGSQSTQTCAAALSLQRPGPACAPALLCSARLAPSAHAIGVESIANICLAAASCSRLVKCRVSCSGQHRASLRAKPTPPSAPARVKWWFTRALSMTLPREKRRRNTLVPEIYEVESSSSCGCKCPVYHTAEPAALALLLPSKTFTPAPAPLPSSHACA